MLQCDCRYYQKSHYHKRLYIRTGEGHGSDRKFTWQPVGEYCTRSHHVYIDSTSATWITVPYEEKS